MKNQMCKFWKYCPVGEIRQRRGEKNYIKEVCQNKEKAKNCPHAACEIRINLLKNEQKVL